MNSSSFSSGGLAVVALFILGACARAITVTPPAPPTAGLEQAGLASWYGYAHQGKRTASGELYDPRDLTAAHRTLPLGTRLMVTNLDNGRVVQVRVNDRGPFVRWRLVDLSYAAAGVLGATARGVFPVRLRVISLPSAAAPVGSVPRP
jgi:rare lipoprotein A